MQFAFTEEQKLIRESVETACKNLCDRAALFRVIEKEDGFYQDAWTILCEDLGLGLTALPEELGGMGLGLTEQASIMEKMGHTLLPTPFFTSMVLSLSALLGHDDRAALEPIILDLAAGKKIASFAFLDPAGQNSAKSGAARLSEDNKVSGTFGFVQYGRQADYIAALVQNAQGAPCLALIDIAANGTSITPRISMDMTRPICDVRFDNTDLISGQPLSLDPPAIERLFDRARICLASEQLGASGAVLEKTREYALERHQFGRAIGSFQAVKHRLADMMVLNEAAKSAAWYAACAADEMPEELSVAAATAMVVTSRALKRNSKNMIQLHGGMGFTWECDAHLYLKRAEMSSRYLGAEHIHRESLAAHALGEIS